MPTESPPDHLELLRRLAESRVEFVVVGGMAAVLQGSSLLTVDIDLCTPFTEASFHRLLPLLVDLDATFRAHPDRPRLEVEPERFTRFRHLLLQTRLGPVDLLRELDGVGTWREVLAASQDLELAGIRCRVLGLEALIQSKRATGRDKDLRALPELEATLRLRRERGL